MAQAARSRAGVAAAIHHGGIITFRDGSVRELLLSTLRKHSTERTVVISVCRIVKRLALSSSAAAAASVCCKSMPPLLLHWQPQPPQKLSMMMMVMMERPTCGRPRQQVWLGTGMVRPVGHAVQAVVVEKMAAASETAIGLQHLHRDLREGAGCAAAAPAVL